MRKLTAALLLILAPLLFAQTQMQVQRQTRSQPDQPPQARSAGPQTKKASAEQAQQQERGLKLLEIAEAQASGLQGNMRAYLQLQLARSYAQTNKAKAIELLESAMTATREADNEGTVTFRSQLQQQILRELVPLAPQRAEELLPQVEPDGREQVLNSLLGYYEKTKDLDRAMELVYQIGQEKEIPYGAAGRIMAALPPERGGDVLQLFTVAFASYRDHPHKQASIGGMDFASLVLRFWQRLPANLVHDAITEILKQAGDVNATLNMSSDAGTANFNSYYDYRLFELLPVLRQIDESEAQELLNKNQEIKAMLAKYPQGAASIAPEMAEPGPPKPDSKRDQKGRGTSFSVSDHAPGTSGAGRSMAAQMAAQSFQEQQVRKIAADADKNPDTALAQAASISNLEMRADLYQMIARAAAKKDPTVAHSALDKLLAITDQLGDDFQLGALRSSAELYLQMGESDDAKKVVERGFKLAEKLLKTDTNADDPNKALKAYWPSAEAYRSFTRLAGQISPEWALTTLKEISDPEMNAVVTTALAQGWLGISRGTTIVQMNSKNRNLMMMSTEGPQ